MDTDWAVPGLENYMFSNIRVLTVTTYDKHYREPAYFGEPYPELVSFFEKHEPKGHVLDLGCGQGRDSITLARMGYRVTGVDISEVGVNQMIKLAREEQLDLTGVVADMYQFPVSEDVDLVLLDSMLHFYPKDKEKETAFLERIMDEIRLGGFLCLIVWKSKKIETVLDSILENAEEWIRIVDDYIRYPEGNMMMRMIVLEKLSTSL